MSEGWFSKPVQVGVGVVGDIRNVSSARQADELLVHHWPDSGTLKHRYAHRSCLGAMRGDGTPEEARAAFVEAAREARILVE